MNTFLQISGDLTVSLALKYTAVGSIPLCYASMVTIILLPLRTRLRIRLNELCEENINAADSARQTVRQESEIADMKQSE